MGIGGWQLERPPYSAAFTMGWEIVGLPLRLPHCSTKAGLFLFVFLIRLQVPEKATDIFRSQDGC